MRGLSARKAFRSVAGLGRFDITGHRPFAVGFGEGATEADVALDDQPVRFREEAEDVTGSGDGKSGVVGLEGGDGDTISPAQQDSVVGQTYNV